MEEEYFVLRGYEDYTFLLLVVVLLMYRDMRLV